VSSLVCGAAASWPLGASALDRAKPGTGFLRITSAEDSAHLAAAFRQGLKESGFIDGEKFAIEYRYPDNHRDRPSGPRRNKPIDQAADVAPLTDLAEGT
jgi:putative ABC transport system substrate-binding protein